MRLVRSGPALLAIVAGCGGSPAPDPRDPTLEGLRGKKVLVVVTSHDAFGNTGDKTGFWLEEVAHFWMRLQRAGLELDIASPRGGTPPMDPRSDDRDDDDNRAFLDDPGAKKKLASTLRPDQVRAEHYAAVYFAGGHGAMWDLRDHERLAAIAAAVYERGGVVAAVCHGPAGLLGIRLSDGSTIVEGRDVTGFTNDEEELLSYDDVVPYLLEDELEASGGNFVPSLFPFTSNVVVSGRLVTGQNPMSTDETADAVIDVLRRIHRR